ncbi:MAG: hypothetical protein LBM98_12420 [Oscillospiraceae bacterium]|nr:hypothetical protein [Oscillospiraceae bacterium]
MKRFLYWWHNVFTYHYGRIALCVLAIALIVIVLIQSSLNTPKFDMHIAVVLTAPVSYDATERLRTMAAEACGDLNGDGDVTVELVTVDLSADPSTTYQQLELLLVQPEYVLFILEDNESLVHGRRGDFNLIENYGFIPDSGSPFRVEISGSPAIETFAPGRTLYACLADWTTSGKGKREWTRAAVDLLDRIIGEIQ